MSKPKHTPGPWRVGVNSDYILDSGSQFICKLNSIDVFHPIDEPLVKPKEANARLIAVAPEMLEFILAVKADCDEQGEHADATYLSAIESILYKIGEQYE